MIRLCNGTGVGNSWMLLESRPAVSKVAKPCNVNVYHFVKQ